MLLRFIDAKIKLQKEVRHRGLKQVYYMSMEFCWAVVKNHLYNNGILDEACQALKKWALISKT